MARKTTSKTTSRTLEKSTGAHKTRTPARAAETRRVTSLEARKGAVLTSLEEAVVRMHHGVSVKPQAQLPTNGVTDELMAQLFEMEVRAHVESGRIDDLPDVPPSSKTKAGATKKGTRPANARTAKVVAELKKRT